MSSSFAGNVLFSYYDKNRSAFVFIEFQAEWLAEDGLLFQRLVQDKDAFLNAVSQTGLILAAARRNSCNIAHAGLDLRYDPTYRLFGGGQNVLELRAAIQVRGQDLAPHLRRPLFRCQES